MKEGLSVGDAAIHDFADEEGMVDGVEGIGDTAVEVGEGVEKDWRSALPDSPWDAGEGAVGGIILIAEALGEVFLIGGEEVDGEDTAGLDEVVS